MLSSFPFASLFCESQSLILSTLGMVHWKFTIWTVKYDKSCLSAYLFRKSLFEIISDRNYLIFDMIHTVADYRPSTVPLQVKTLLPCILLLTPEIEEIYYWDYRKYSCNRPEILISIVDSLYFRVQILYYSILL